MCWLIFFWIVLCHRGWHVSLFFNGTTLTWTMVRISNEGYKTIMNINLYANEFFGWFLSENNHIFLAWVISNFVWQCAKNKTFFDKNVKHFTLQENLWEVSLSFSPRYPFDFPNHHDQWSLPVQFSMKDFLSLPPVEPAGIRTGKQFRIWVN